MANKQIVDYIKEASSDNLKKAEIIQNLKEAGWDDVDIRDGFAYVNLYTNSPYQTKFTSKIVVEPTTVASRHWLSLVSLVIGFLWLISGLNKILSDEFVSGFLVFVQNQIAINPSGALDFYKSILSTVVLPHASLMAHIIQYSEFAVGVSLVVFGLWNFIRSSKWLVFALCLASIGSFLLILNIILTLAMPLPWIDTQNIFAQGINVEYIVLFISAVLSMAYFSEL